MARFDLPALLAEESATRRPLMLRPPTPGNPVMEQMGGGGFQITPEELAFKAQGDPDKARRGAILPFLAGGPMRGMKAYRTGIERSRLEQIREKLGVVYGRAAGTEGLTAEDMNQLAYLRASYTGEQPRTFRPSSPMISRRTIHTRNDSGVMMSQDQRVRTDPNTGDVLDVKDIGDSYRKNALKRRAPITLDQEAKYNRVQDYRGIISAGGWQEEVLAMIKEIDPDKKIDVNDKNVAMLLFGSKARDNLPDFRVDYLESLATALDSTAGDIEFGTEKWRKGAKREFVKELMGLWDQHKYGDGATTTDPNLAGDMDERLKSLGAGAAVTTQDPSLLSQVGQAFRGGGDPYARQPATAIPALAAPRDPNVPGYRPEQFAGPGVSGIAPPMTTRSAPPAGGPAAGYAGLGPMQPGKQPWEKGPSTMDRLQGGLDEVATSFAEWQGPARAGEVLQRELETAGRGPMPLSRLGGDFRRAASSLDQSFGAQPAFDPFSSRNVGAGARSLGGGGARANVTTPDVMAGIREQLTDLDLAVERAIEEEPRADRRKAMRKKKKGSKLQEALKEIVEGGATRRASVTTPDIMSEIREQLKQLDLAVR